MTVTVRFAPSPTGHIHIGNARTALFNWLFARKNNGRFVLRFDDTDVERSRKEYAEGIVRDLAWLGIEPDETVAQSARFERYDAAAERLKAAGLLYPCYETPEELERRRKIRLSRRLPPVYGREALKLTKAETEAFEAEGRKPHWRFLLPNFSENPFSTERTEVHWNDVVRGPQTVDLASMSDPVLIRADGTYLYTLPSVVDDIDLGISHVIRGDDHVTNTGAQIAIFRALGAEPPAFGHHNLLTTVSGEGLSKRTGALSIASLREAGVEAMAVASLAVLIGTSENVVAAADMNELAALFVPEATSKSAAKFDPAELDVLSRHLLQAMPFEQAEQRLSALGIQGENARAFWVAVQGNLDRMSDAGIWWNIVHDQPDPAGELSTDDREFVQQAAAHLPAEPWDQDTWRDWTNAVKAASGRKGKALFMPLRIALTGRASGPELSGLLPLLGRAETQARLA
ncbi:glutamyl-tRNA ligase [Nitratireductor indicus C115]|uniref:Glutamate--tRNA ligase n=1 Tax=Nitratireductor indicus C115 TaxID=1231190 RepID=K2P9B0_9HYPH|nr:glutamate--tRNA ligase [Nitratireductor indicus]EKF43786.1 glutamyl-tRNA ligase [Nitratireductor indicus C115]SFQ17013.1 glutamyl-tRNA synthetase [Nitratireductor indicus]